PHPGRGASTIVYVVPVFGWPYAAAALPGPPPAPLAPASPLTPVAPPVPQPAPEPVTADRAAGGSASPDSPLSGIRPTEPPPPPVTIYMIPGCYIGNLPPREVTLP